MSDERPISGPVPDSPELRAWAAAARDRGRAAWPALEVSEPELIQLVALRAAGRGKDIDPDELQHLDAGELYLVAACAKGDPAALRELRRAYFEPARRALHRAGIVDSQHEDVWQTLCERFLVSEAGAAPRLIRYAGAGELKGLIRVAATRAALKLLEKDRRQVIGDGDDWLRALPAAASDPELHTMKQQHRDDLKQELAVVVAGLSARDRMVLRFHLIDRLGIDAIASMCAVHRATAARMVSRAREQVVDQLRNRLVSRWSVAQSDLPALKTLIDSQIDLSLRRLFAG